MGAKATAVNPAVLRWARERAGLTIEQAAMALGKSPEVILDWESGADFPTYVQLEGLADKVYRRPIALFFFPAPPAEERADACFRTVSARMLSTFDPDTFLATREALRFRESLRDLTGARNPSRTMITQAFSPASPDDLTSLVARVRDYLGVSLVTQRSWRNADAALKEWRLAIESCGVFVFKRSFKDENVLGFAMTDAEFPVVMLNNSTAFARQIFTLFHELAHLLFGVNSLTFRDFRTLDRFDEGYRGIERACNQFASEFLLPAAEFPQESFRSGSLDERVALVARDFSVSRLVILVRLRELGLIDEGTLVEKTDQYYREYQEWKARRAPGGHYYNTHVSYLGHSYLALVFSQLHSGRISIEESADHLRVRARNISALEDAFLAGR